MKISTVHVVRHGQTTWNAVGRIQGQSESPLSELGERQARRVVEGFSGVELAAIHSSDLQRARQTAAPLAAACGLTPTFDPRLRERAYGDLETLTWAEVEARHPELYAQLRAGEPSVRIPNGESREDLLSRVGAAFDALADRHVDQQIAVITHGGVAAAFFTLVTGLPADRRPPVRTLNGGISTFERWGRDWKLVTWGSIAHLGDALSERPPPGTATTA